MPSPFPTWLLHSGLPQRLKTESCGSAAWLLLRTIIDLDCRRSTTEPVDTSIANLAIVTGLTDAEIQDILPVYRKTAVAKYYVPDDEAENALIQLNDPLPTPQTHRQVIALMIPDPAISIHRYCDCPEARDFDPADPVLQEIIDLYLNGISLRINQFIIDRLKNLRHKTDIGAIRWAFKLAAKNNSHSLDFVERQALKIKDKKFSNR